MSSSVSEKRSKKCNTGHNQYNKNIFIVVEYQLYYPGTLILFTIQKNESD